MLFLSSLDNLLYDAYTFFEKRCWWFWDWAQNIIFWFGVQYPLKWLHTLLSTVDEKSWFIFQWLHTLLSTIDSKIVTYYVAISTKIAKKLSFFEDFICRYLLLQQKFIFIDFTHSHCYSRQQKVYFWCLYVLLSTVDSKRSLLVTFLCCFLYSRSTVDNKMFTIKLLHISLSTVDSKRWFIFKWL